MTTRIKATMGVAYNHCFDRVKETIVKNGGTIYSYILKRDSFIIEANILGDNTFWLIKQALLREGADFSFNPL